MSKYAYINAKYASVRRVFMYIYIYKASECHTFTLGYTSSPWLVELAGLIVWVDPNLSPALSGLQCCCCIYVSLCIYTNPQQNSIIDTQFHPITNKAFKKPVIWVLSALLFASPSLSLMT
jgi:hypothetical protein